MGRDSGPANYEIEREKFVKRLRFGEFVEKVRTAGVTNDFYLTATNNSSNKQVLAGLWDDIVQIPEYLDDRDPLGGFFWLGPAGTITPFHHDLTNNFMAQVIGRKRVKLVPSWDMPLMANDSTSSRRVDGRVTPPSPHPAPGSRGHRVHPQPRRDPFPPNWLAPLRRGDGYLCHRLVHQLRLRQRFRQLLYDLPRRLNLVGCVQRTIF